MTAFEHLLENSYKAFKQYQNDYDSFVDEVNSDPNWRYFHEFDEGCLYDICAFVMEHVHDDDYNIESKAFEEGFNAGFAEAKSQFSKS